MNDSTLARLAAKYGTPLYVYDAEVIRGRAKLFFASIPFHRKRIYYATKANGNVSLLRLLRKCGVHADTFSPGEVFLARRAGFPPDHIIFSGNNASDDDLAYVSREGVTFNIDTQQILDWNRLAKNATLRPGQRLTLLVKNSSRG